MGKYVPAEKNFIRVTGKDQVSFVNSSLSGNEGRGNEYNCKPGQNWKPDI